MKPEGTSIPAHCSNGTVRVVVIGRMQSSKACERVCLTNLAACEGNPEHGERDGGASREREQRLEKKFAGDHGALSVSSWIAMRYAHREQIVRAALVQLL